KAIQETRTDETSPTLEPRGVRLVRREEIPNEYHEEADQTDATIGRILARHVRSSAAQHFWSGNHSAARRNRHRNRDRRRREGGRLRQCRRRVFSDSLRFPREARG